MDFDYAQLAVIALSAINVFLVVVVIRKTRILSDKVDSVRLSTTKILFNKIAPEKCEKCGKEIESHTIKEAKDCGIKLDALK
jgi:predicted Zn-ribbon and HTH transcriptional regulator